MIFFSNQADARNINEAMQLLFDRINNAFKLCCPIRTKTVPPKNTTKPCISGEVYANIKKKGKTTIHLLDKTKLPFNSTHDLEILSQIKLAKQKSSILSTNFNNIYEGDCKSTWKQINSIIRLNRINKINIINKISENYITYETNHDIAKCTQFILCKHM